MVNLRWSLMLLRQGWPLHQGSAAGGTPVCLSVLREHGMALAADAFHTSSVTEDRRGSSRRLDVQRNGSCPCSNLDPVAYVCRGYPIERWNGKAVDEAERRGYEPDVESPAENVDLSGMKPAVALQLLRGLVARRFKIRGNRARGAEDKDPRAKRLECGLMELYELVKCLWESPDVEGCAEDQRCPSLEGLN